MAAGELNKPPDLSLEFNRQLLSQAARMAKGPNRCPQQLGKPKLEQALTVEQQGDLIHWGHGRPLAEDQVQADGQIGAKLETIDGISHRGSPHHQTGALQQPPIGQGKDGPVDRGVQSQVIGVADWGRPQRALQSSHLPGCQAPDPIVHRRWCEHQHQDPNKRGNPRGQQPWQEQAQGHIER